MKQQNDDAVQEYQPAAQQIQSKQRKVEHPPEQYLVNQIYSIRKQSSNIANDHIYKKLTKSFHRIKKLRAQPNGSTIISREFDYENNPIRLAFRRVREAYNNSTKTNLIVKKKIDKMRNKVDRIKKQVQNSQMYLVKEVDINKIFSKNNHNTNTTNQPPSQQASTLQKQKLK